MPEEKIEDEGNRKRSHRRENLWLLARLAVVVAKLLVVLIADYEAKHFTVEKTSGIEVLKELMDSNGLRQKDLAGDLGGESIVSLILQGKRQLNRQQMEKLSHRFQVSPAVFF